MVRKGLLTTYHVPLTTLTKSTLMNIGPINIEKPIALAPMEDVTDMPFRVICKRLGADLVYTEFTASEALIRDIPKALKKITVCDEERPVAIQLFGGKDESLASAAKVAEGFKPDFIDINCGCWVKNHVARNEGAGLLRDLPLFEIVFDFAHPQKSMGIEKPTLVAIFQVTDHDIVIGIPIFRSIPTGINE